LGKLMLWLKQNHLYDSSLIVALSDHGESLGEHGEDEHGFFIYNATLHVPLIVKFPGNSFGPRKFAPPVSTVDVAPTIAQLCAVPSAETRSFQGRSLSPALSSAANGEDA